MRHNMKEPLESSEINECSVISFDSMNSSIIRKVSFRLNENKILDLHTYTYQGEIFLSIALKNTAIIIYLIRAHEVIEVANIMNPENFNNKVRVFSFGKRIYTYCDNYSRISFINLINYTYKFVQFHERVSLMLASKKDKFLIVSGFSGEIYLINTENPDEIVKILHSADIGYANTVEALRLCNDENNICCLYIDKSIYSIRLKYRKIIWKHQSNNILSFETSNKRLFVLTCNQVEVYSISKNSIEIEDIYSIKLQIKNDISSLDHSVTKITLFEKSQEIFFMVYSLKNYEIFKFRKSNHNTEVVESYHKGYLDNCIVKCNIFLDNSFVFLQNDGSLVKLCENFDFIKDKKKYLTRVLNKNMRSTVVGYSVTNNEIFAFSINKARGK